MTIWALALGTNPKNLIYYFQSSKKRKKHGCYFVIISTFSIIQKKKTWMLLCHHLYAWYLYKYMRHNLISPRWKNYLLSCAFNSSNLPLGVKKSLIFLLKVSYRIWDSTFPSRDMINLTYVCTEANITIKWNERYDTTNCWLTRDIFI